MENIVHFLPMMRQQPFVCAYLLAIDFCHTLKDSYFNYYFLKVNLK